EGQVLGFLFPAHQQATRAIEPRVGALHHESVGHESPAPGPCPASPLHGYECAAGSGGSRLLLALELCHTLHLSTGAVDGPQLALDEQSRGYPMSRTAV